MTTKEALQEKREELRGKREELSKVKSEIREVESKKREAENDSTLGLLQMSNNSLRPLGTYNYLTNSDKASTLKKQLSDLKDKQRDLERDVRDLEYDVKRLEEQVEYESRPEAELVIGKDSIYIKGNEDNNLITPLMWDISAYTREYQRLIESDKFKNFPMLEQTIADKKAELEALVKTLDLPEDTEENRRTLRSYQSSGNARFDFMEIDGKLLVDADFTAASISDKEFVKSTYEKSIEENKKRYDTFEPSLTGKIFKGLGKKQKAEWDSQVAAKEAELKASIETVDKDIARLKAVQAKFVTPSEPARKLLQQISELVNESYSCKRVVKDAEEHKQTIESHTILTGKTEQALMRLMLSTGSSYYLDQNKLKLTKETIFDAICENEQFADLAQEIMNATGYKPSKKTKQDEPAGPSNG